MRALSMAPFFFPPFLFGKSTFVGKGTVFVTGASGFLSFSILFLSEAFFLPRP